MVVRAGMPTLLFYFFEGTVGLRPWIAAVSQMEVRAGMPTLPLGEGCTHYHWGGMHTLPYLSKYAQSTPLSFDGCRVASQFVIEVH
jgi:hypothetical protein